MQKALTLLKVAKTLGKHLLEKIEMYAITQPCLVAQKSLTAFFSTCSCVYVQWGKEVPHSKVLITNVKQSFVQNASSFLLSRNGYLIQTPYNLLQLSRQYLTTSLLLRTWFDPFCLFSMTPDCFSSFIEAQYFSNEQ